MRTYEEPNAEFVIIDFVDIMTGSGHGEQGEDEEEELMSETFDEMMSKPY